MDTWLNATPAVSASEAGHAPSHESLKIRLAINPATQLAVLLHTAGFQFDKGLLLSS